MGFIDTHVHLHFPDYDEDREEVIDRAHKAGIDYFINVGTDIPTSKASLELSEKYDYIYATAGVHPHDAKDADEQVLNQMAEMLRDPKFIAIGEIGLDFYRDHSPHDIQEKVLRRFLAIHREVDKPLILHCRDAYEQLIAVLKDELKPPCKGIIHCFSSDKETMNRLLDLGFYISFAGPLTYKKNDILREACLACPPDRLLLETDAPFLPPQSKRGKRNESSLLLETAKVCAEIHDFDLTELACRTSANAKAVFGL